MPYIKLTFIFRTIPALSEKDVRGEKLYPLIATVDFFAASKIYLGRVIMLRRSREKGRR